MDHWHLLILFINLFEKNYLMKFCFQKIFFDTGNGLEQILEVFEVFFSNKKLNLKCLLLWATSIRSKNIRISVVWKFQSCDFSTICGNNHESKLTKLNFQKFPWYEAVKNRENFKKKYALIIKITRVFSRSFVKKK